MLLYNTLLRSPAPIRQRTLCATCLCMCVAPSNFFQITIWEKLADWQAPFRIFAQSFPSPGLQAALYARGWIMMPFCSLLAAKHWVVSEQVSNYAITCCITCKVWANSLTPVKTSLVNVGLLQIRGIFYSFLVPTLNKYKDLKNIVAQIFQKKISGRWESK